MVRKAVEIKGNFVAKKSTLYHDIAKFVLYIYIPSLLPSE